jgi:hypothetical protein
MGITAIWLDISQRPKDIRKFLSLATRPAANSTPGL